MSYMCKNSQEKNDKGKNEKKLVQPAVRTQYKIQKLKYGDNGILLGK